MAFRRISDLSSSLSPSGDGIIPISEGGKTYGITLDTIKGQIEGVLTSSFTDSSSHGELSSSVGNNSTSIDSLNQFTSSADDRLVSLETFTGSLDDTFATDLEVTQLRNYFNSYTSSNNNINSEQTDYQNSLGDRLNSIETFTGSLSDTVNDIITIEGRLDDLEVESGSIRSEFNSFTSSFLLISESFDQRISALENPVSTPSPTDTPVPPTSTPVPTATVEPTPTPEPLQPTPTSTVEPTPTPEPLQPTPTATVEPTPTSTVEPLQNILMVTRINSLPNPTYNILTGNFSGAQQFLCNNTITSASAQYRQTSGDPTNPQNGDMLYHNGNLTINAQFGFFWNGDNNVSYKDTWRWITTDSNGVMTVSQFNCPTPTPTDTPVPTETEVPPTPTPTTDYTLFEYMIVWRRNTVANGMTYDFTRLDGNGDYFYSNEQIKCVYETFGTGGGNLWNITVGDNSEGLISVGDDSWNRVSVGNPTNIVGSFNSTTRAVWYDNTDRLGNGVQHYIITFVSGEVTDLVSFDSIGDVSGCVPYVDPTPTPTSTVEPTPTPTVEPTGTPVPNPTPTPTVNLQDISLVLRINNDGGVDPWLSGSSTYNDVQNHLCTYGANNYSSGTRQTTGDPNSPQTGDIFYAGGFPIDPAQNVLYKYNNGTSVSDWRWIEIDSSGYITVSGFTCSTPTPTATVEPTSTPEPTPTSTPVPNPTATEVPPTPTPTDTPVPTSTEVPPSPTPTATDTPEPTPTSTVEPTSTPVPSTPTPTPTVSLTCLDGDNDNTVNYGEVFFGAGNYYIFNGNYETYHTNTGTYLLKNVSSGHPITVLNYGKESLIYVDGTPAGTKIGSDGNSYTYYYGDVTITVQGNYGTVSYECYYHGYMGGQDNLVFSNTCPISPTPTPTIAVEPTSTSVPPTSTPVPTPTSTPVPSPTSTPSPTPTNTPVPSPTPTPSSTETINPTPTPTIPPSQTPQPTPTSTPSPTTTVNPTSTPVPSPTPTVEPTSTPVPSPTPTVEPTSTPVDPTPTPTVDAANTIFVHDQ
jgi:hypothetical protein